MQEYEYLIVGQGIAGTLLAHNLLKENKNILVFDIHNQNSSSYVAAGIFNPITGRRNTSTWMANIVFPYAEKIYKELEQYLNVDFYHQMNIYKSFSSIKEQNDWYAKENIYSSNNSKIDYIDSKFEYINLGTNGGIEISNSGYIDMPVFINAFKAYLFSKKIIYEEYFQYSKMNFHDNFIYYKNFRFKQVIFCEGYQAIHNPYFSWLPFVPAKGELITIYADQLKLDKIINKGIFILPIGNNLYKVGATYNWEYLNDEPTEDGKNQLCNKLNQILTCNYTIIAHQAGIRPTVKDRRPILGMHPLYPNLGIFNGLGTKGASLAPYFANHFVEFLLKNIPLIKDVNINRFSI
jgi:glycine/D-amino acid oxidase-like deaminating enzyme